MYTINDCVMVAMCICLIDHHKLSPNMSLKSKLLQYCDIEQRNYLYPNTYLENRLSIKPPNIFNSNFCAKKIHLHKSCKICEA